MSEILQNNRNSDNGMILPRPCRVMQGESEEEMALIKADGTILYQGAVLDTNEHYWLDGMLSEYALVWDMEKHQYETVSVGYYGADGRDFIGTKVETDLSTEVARDIIRTLKHRAYEDFCLSVIEKKNSIEAGITARVVRGRKIPKGTILNVFWVGERPTYTGYGTELIAGCRDENGNKVWIKVEYLKNISPLKSPNAKERGKYIKWYIKKNAGNMVMNQAAG